MKHNNSLLQVIKPPTFSSPGVCSIMSAIFPVFLMIHGLIHVGVSDGPSLQCVDKCRCGSTVSSVLLCLLTEAQKKHKRSSFAQNGPLLDYSRVLYLFFRKRTFNRSGFIKLSACRYRLVHNKNGDYITETFRICLWKVLTCQIVTMVLSTNLCYIFGFCKGITSP